MSKRVVVNADGTIKKKRGCCCSCFLTVFIISLVLIVGGTIVGCVFLDKFTKEKFDMSLKETFGVVSSLYWAKDKDIVTNGYTEADEEGFNSEIKKQLFLKDSAQLDIAGAVQEALALTGNGGQSSADPLTAAVGLYSESGESDTADGTDGSGASKGVNEKLLDFITGLVDEDSVDYDRLKNYSDDKYDEFCLNIQDRELAAFLNAVITEYMNSNAELSAQLSEFGIDSVDRIAALREINFGVENRTYITETGEYSSDKKDVAVAYITLQLKLDNAVESVVSSRVSNKFFSMLASAGIKAVLPNNLYVTVGIGLSDNIGINVRLNRIDTDEELQSTYKLVRGISGLAGSEFDLKQYLDDTANEKINPIVEKLDGAADYSKMSEHKMVVDTYGVLASLISDSDETDKLTGPELLGTVSSLVTSDPYGAVADEHRYDIWYEKDGVRYRLDDENLPQGAVKVDYAELFMEQLDSKYLVDVFERDDTGAFVLDGNGRKIVMEGRSFSELIKAFGMDGGSAALNDLINMDRYHEIASLSADQLKITVTDKMFGAIVTENLASLGADAVQSTGLDARVIQLAIINRTDGEKSTDWADISAEIDMQSYFDGLGGIGSFLGIFLPDKIVVTVSVDITVGRTEETREPSTLRYNSMTAEQTEKMLSVMEKFGVSGFDTASLTSMIADPVHQIFDNMCESLALEIRPSLLTAEKLDPSNAGSDRYNDVSSDSGNSDLIISSVYDILENNVFTRVDPDTGVKETIAADDIKDVMDILFAYGERNEGSAALIDALKSGSAVASDYSALQAELEQKYYLKSVSANPENKIETFDSLLNVINVDNFSSDRFDIAAFDAAGESAGYGRPVISEGELGRLFAEKMSDASGDMDFTVLTVDSVAASGSASPMIKVLMEIDMSRTMGERINLMPAGKIYVTMTIYMGENDVVTDPDDPSRSGYRTEISVNGMTPDDAIQQSLFKMFSMFSQDGLADINGIAVDVGCMLHEQLSVLSERIGGGEISLTDSGVQLISFRDYLATVGFRY